MHESLMQLLESTDPRQILIRKAPGHNYWWGIVWVGGAMEAISTKKHANIMDVMDELESKAKEYLQAERTDDLQLTEILVTET